MKVLPLGKKLTVAIDVDGTVANSSHIDFSMVDKNLDELMKARPIKEALKTVQRLHKQGHKKYHPRDLQHKAIHSIPSPQELFDFWDKHKEDLPPEWPFR